MQVRSPCHVRSFDVTTVTCIGICGQPEDAVMVARCNMCTNATACAGHARCWTVPAHAEHGYAGACTDETIAVAVKGLESLADVAIAERCHRLVPSVLEFAPGAQQSQNAKACVPCGLICAFVFDAVAHRFHSAKSTPWGFPHVIPKVASAASGCAQDHC